MTKDKQVYTLLSVFYRHPRLIQGLSLVGSLGFLSGSLVMAQSDSPIDVIVPAIPEAPPPPAPAPAVQAPPPPAPAPVVQAPPPPAPAPRAVPKLAPPAPVAPVRRKPAPVVQAPPPRAPKPAPASALRKPAPSVSTPAPTAASAPKKPTLSAPNISVPSDAIARPPQVILSPTFPQENASTPGNASSAYIDRTDYSVGTTRRNQSPASVVLSDRATGCKTVSQNGRLTSAVCGVTVPTRSVARSNQGTAILRQQTASIAQPIINSGRSLSTSTPQFVRPPVRQRSVAAVPRVNRRFTSVGSVGIQQTARRTTRALFQTVQPPKDSILYNAIRRPQALPGNGQTSLIFPLSIPASITSVFGWRVHPISGNRRFHYGTDIGAAMGTPVLAAYEGEVAVADFQGGYGLMVVLRHEDGTQESRYAHLSEVYVQPGEWIEQGTVIGRVGSTGNSTGPHLHFEWRHQTSDGWIAVDATNHLDYSLAEFVKSLQTAQANSRVGGV